MDRRALAQRNRKPQANNAAQDKPRHSAGSRNQNGYQSENRQNPFKSPVNSVVDVSSNGGGGGAPALKTGECVVCRGKAICVCQRCGDYYCSPECQHKDWPSHRYICFPVPALVHPATTLSTDALYPVEKPLMTVNHLTNSPLDNRQNILNELFNSNLGKNNQYQYPQHLGLNGQQHPQQQQRYGQNNNNRGGSQQNANKNQMKNKEPTATLPLAVLPKNNSRVILTGFRTPNRCYIRPLTNEENEDYLLNARKIDSYGKNAPPLGKVPKQHTYAIAPYEGAMYRVEIQQAQERNPDSIRVLFLDRGISATRRLNQLREISDEILSLKQYACMIPLRNVSNYVLSSEMTKFFNTFEDREFKIKYERVEDGIELLHWQTEKSLNDEIEQFCKESGAQVWADTVRKKQETDKKGNQAAGGSKKTIDDVKSPNSKKEKTPEKAAAAVVNGDDPDEQYYAKSETSTPSGTEKAVKKVEQVEEVQRPTMNAPFETHYFKVGCAPFKAIVLDVSCLEIGYIGCIAQIDLACLQTVHKQLSSIEVPNKPYVPKLNEYCIAKFEDVWYRAQVIDIPDDTHFTVMYIDFTNEATLTSAEIRHYPASVTGVCKSNLCLIDGLPSDFSAELIKFLNEEVSIQDVITIDGVKKIDEQVVVIECKNLLSKIQQKNLLG